MMTEQEQADKIREYLKEVDVLLTDLSHKGYDVGIRLDHIWRQGRKPEKALAFWAVKTKTTSL